MIIFQVETSVSCFKFYVINLFRPEKIIEHMLKHKNCFLVFKLRTVLIFKENIFAEINII